MFDSGPATEPGLKYQCVSECVAPRHTQVGRVYRVRLGEHFLLPSYVLCDRLLCLPHCFFLGIKDSISFDVVCLA